MADQKASGESNDSSSPSSKSVPPSKIVFVGPEDKVPNDQIALNFLLVSGKRKEGWLFNPILSVEQVLKIVTDNWPSEFKDANSSDAPNPAHLKILHRGRFLDPLTTLDGNKIPKGDATTVHLVVRASKEGEQSKSEEPNSKCCCIIL